jgi:hypothetical protein
MAPRPLNGDYVSPTIPVYLAATLKIIEKSLHDRYSRPVEKGSTTF